MFTSTVSITDLQETTLNAQCIDVTGMPMDAPVVPVWTNSNNAVATITPAVDGMTCLVVGVAMGFTDVTVTVNAVATTTRVVVDPPILNYVQVTADAPVAQ